MHRHIPQVPQDDRQPNQAIVNRSRPISMTVGTYRVIYLLSSSSLHISPSRITSSTLPSNRAARCIILRRRRSDKSLPNALHMIVKLERQMQAVFVSYAAYGKWHPDAIASHLIVDQCPSQSIGFHKFIILVRDAKSVKDAFPEQDILRLFRKHSSPVSCAARSSKFLLDSFEKQADPAS